MKYSEIEVGQRNYHVNSNYFLAREQIFQERAKTGGKVRLQRKSGTKKENESSFGSLGGRRGASVWRSIFVEGEEKGAGQGRNRSSFNFQPRVSRITDVKHFFSSTTSKFCAHA